MSASAARTDRGERGQGPAAGAVLAAGAAYGARLALPLDRVAAGIVDSTAALVGDRSLDRSRAAMCPVEPTCPRAHFWTQSRQPRYGEPVKRASCR